MRTHAIMAAVSLCCAVAACLFFAAGGCGCGRTAPDAPPAPASTSSSDSVSAREIDESARMVGRLERRVKVLATVYTAGEATPRECEIWLAPGTWLIPAAVFVEPAPGDREDGDAL